MAGENEVDLVAKQEGAWKSAPMNGLASTPESDEKKKDTELEPLSADKWVEDGEVLSKVPEGVDAEAFAAQTIGNIGKNK